MMKDSKIKRGAILICMGIIIIGVLLVYSHITRNRISEYSKFTVAQNSAQIANWISSQLKNSIHSIKMTSQLAENSMNDESFSNSRQVLNFLLRTTSFDFIEHIDKNGVNTMVNGEKIDVSDRVYYTEGIKGFDGVWIDYSPKLSSGYLVNFYTPINYKGRTSGVLTGTLGAKSAFLPTLKMSSFFGKEMIGLICDQNNQIICSTYDVIDSKDAALIPPKKLEEQLSSIGIMEEWIKQFDNKSKKHDNSVFRFDGAKGYSFACVTPIKETGWFLVEIVPSTAFQEVMYRSVYEELIAIGIIALMFIIYIIHVRIKSRNDNRAHERIEAMLESESLHDNLTGVLNRRAFDNAIDLIESEVSLNNTCVIELDVNSLKKVNDNIGHEAGDELIKAAADCIKNAFGKIGTCYRTGGDEFTVILRNSTEKLSDAIKTFQDFQKTWKGKLVDKLSISIGTAKAEDYPTESINHLLHIADEKMYENKREHYANNK